MRRFFIGLMALAVALLGLVEAPASAMPTGSVTEVEIDGSAASGEVFSFYGEKSQIVGIEVTGVGYTQIDVWQENTDKVVLTSRTKVSPAYLHFVLPGAGRYEIAAVAFAAGKEVPISTNCRLRSPVVESISVDGPSVSASLVPSQSAVFTFSGEAGQIIGLDSVKQSVADSGGFQLTLVQDSTGDTLAKDTANTRETETGLSAVLPAAGTYRLIVSPYPFTESYSGTMTTRLISPVTGTPGLDQPALVIPVVPSQSLVLSYQGTRHQVVGLYLNKLNVIRDGDLQVDVIQATTGLSISTDVMLHNDSSTALALDLPGTSMYYFRIMPKNSHGFIHRSNISAQLISPVPVGVTASGTPFESKITPGQSAVFNFSGKKGQLLGFAFDKLGFTYDADFNLRVTDLTTQRDLATDRMLKNDIQSSIGVVLPSTGNYQAVVSPKSPNVFAGTIQVTVKAPATQVIRRGGSAKTALTVGQGAQFRFNASRGQTLNLFVVKTSLVREANLQVLVLSSSTGRSVASGLLAINAGALKTKVRIPTSGQYRVIVIPANATASYKGGVTVSLK